MNCVKLPLDLNSFAKFLAPGLAFLLFSPFARAVAEVPNIAEGHLRQGDRVRLTQNPLPNGNLTELERQAIAEINRARTNPTAYADWLESMKQYYSGNVLQLPNHPPILTQEGVQAVDEAIGVLRALRPLPPLQLSVGMSMAARDHANDIGSKGIVGHYGSDGSQFFDRINRYGSSNGAVGQNISYGAISAEAVAMQMIVDDGVAGRFHRDNVLYDRFNVAGIACGAHRRYQQICTIVYSHEYRDRVAVNPLVSTPTNPTRLGTSPLRPAFPDAAVSPSPQLSNNAASVEILEYIPSSQLVNSSASTEIQQEEGKIEFPDNNLEISVENSEIPVAVETVPEPPTAPPNPEEPAIQLPELALEESEEESEEPSPPETETDPIPVAPPSPSELLPETDEQTILQEEGTLADGDSVYERDGSLYDVYSFEGKSGQEIAIAVESDDFDTFLAVFDDQDAIVGQNDDIAIDNTNSFLEITIPRDGTYRIFINGYDARDRGSYTVRVVE